MKSSDPVITECCNERRRLAEELSIAARLYAEIVATLGGKRFMSQDEYDRVCKAAMDAQQRSEQCGIAFEEHLASHGCELPLGEGGAIDDVPVRRCTPSLRRCP